MPTEPVLGAMQTAAMAGVDVRLMIPEKPDGFWLRWSGYSYVTEMLRAGVRVYFFRPGFLHSKAIVSDDRLCSIGSGNIDFRSLENNFETNAIIYEDWRLPAEEPTAERSYHDKTARTINHCDMECYRDSDGNLYDFAFGLTF